MSISHTAAFIAVKLYGLTRNPKAAVKFDPFVIRFYERLLLSLPIHLRWYHSGLKSKVLRGFFIASEELLLPGDLMHILCRKYFVGLRVQKLIDQGYEQIVNIGAGFDHLGAYYSQKGVPVFELDFQNMASSKRNFLTHEQMTNEYLHILDCDLENQSLADVIASSSNFDPDKKTVFVAEGLFDYLDRHPSKKLVEDICSIHSENKLVTTFFSLDELNGFHRWVFKSGVSLVGESLKFNISRNEFVDLLEEWGLSLTSEINHAEMRKEFVEEIGFRLPVLRGFYVQEFEIRN